MISKHQKYLFVTGCYRSGTTLLARILNLHPQVRLIAGETHFLGHMLRKGVRHFIREFGAFDNEDNLKKAVDFMYNLPPSMGAIWNYLRKNINKNEFVEILSVTDKSDRDIFHEIIKIYGKGNSVIGEKTPSHVYHVATLLDWFPNAKVINILRDPRAIFLSEYKRKVSGRKGINRLLYYLYKLIHVSISWNYICYLHFKYSKKYKYNYCFVKFETLILNPEETIQRLCRFVNINFDQAMLEPSITNSSFVKNKHYRGIYYKALNGWKERINIFTNIFFASICRFYLKKLGYRIL